MGYSEQAALAVDPTFQAKIRMAILEEAMAVLKEKAGDSGPLHQARITLAVKVLSDGGRALLEPFIYAVASINTITDKTEDLGLAGAIKGVWSAVAGAET